MISVKLSPAALLALATAGAACGGAGVGAPPSEASGTSMFALTTDQFQGNKTFSVSQSGCALDTGIAVKKGDVIRTVATGTITVTSAVSGTFTPDGDVGMGGTDYAFVNRPVFALFGCVGQNVIRFGSDAVFTAPDSGNIKLGINGCAPGAGTACTLSGEFDVNVYTLPRVEVATIPTILDNTRGPTQTVSIDANAGWTGTGITLKRGQKTFIDASGTIVVGASSGSTSPQTFDPDGDDGSWAGTSYQLVNRAPDRLYARVGTSVVDLGAHAVFLSPAAGQLELIVNHADNTTGTVAANVSLGVVPARDLTEEDLEQFKQHATVNVDPVSGWVTADIHVDAGDPVFTLATGQLTLPDNSTVGPYGLPAVGGTSYPIGMHPVEALHGGLGSEVFFLGGQDTFLSPAPAQLKLIINATGKESGSFTATIAAP
jgi:hypothetical protein